ncbi:MAG: HIT domain-containing protein [Planctomycetota bacterium]|nr:MAG: HIT domain-containing protein [Planctomycetota bacterium]
MPEHPSETPQTLFAPWRLEYLEALDAKEKRTGPPAEGSGSFLLDYWKTPERDESNHVVARTSRGLILLNRFPYAGGHLLVALGEAAPTLLDYTPEQRAELWKLVDLAAELMQRTLEPQGVNIGINQGRAAGAGVPQHLHVHLVPRWNGDVNFMAAVGSVRVIPSSLEAMTQRFRDQWSRMTPNTHS